eukprot:s2280_g4.t7
MSDASKRRMVSPPAKEERETVLSGEPPKKITGDSPASFGAKLPAGIKDINHWGKTLLEDINHWGKTLLEVGKYGKDGFSYEELQASTRQEHQSYCTWLISQRFRVDLTPAIKDLIRYLYVKIEHNRGEEKFFEGSTDYLAEGEELPKVLTFAEASAIVSRGAQQVLIGWSADGDFEVNPKSKLTPRAWTAEDRLVRTIRELSPELCFGAVLSLETPGCKAMAGSDVRLRVGAVEGGFAADGSEELPDLSKHKSLAAEVLLKRSDLYPKMKDRQTKLGIHLARCIKAAVDTPDSSDTCCGPRRVDLAPKPEIPKDTHLSWRCASHVSCHVERRTGCVFGPVCSVKFQPSGIQQPSQWPMYLDPEAADSEDEETGTAGTTAGSRQNVKERCKAERSERSERSDPKEPIGAMHSWLRGFTIVLFNFTTSIMLVNSVKCLYDPGM